MKKFNWTQVREFAASQITRRLLINPNIDERKLTDALRTLSSEKKFKKWLKQNNLK